MQGWPRVDLPEEAVSGESLLSTSRKPNALQCVDPIMRPASLYSYIYPSDEWEFAGPDPVASTQSTLVNKRLCLGTWDSDTNR